MVEAVGVADFVMRPVFQAQRRGAATDRQDVQDHSNPSQHVINFESPVLIEYADQSISSISAFPGRIQRYSDELDIISLGESTGKAARPELPTGFR